MVVEDLHSGAQQHWLGHSEEISTLALSHDAQVLVLRITVWLLGGLWSARGTLFWLPIRPEPDGPLDCPHRTDTPPPCLARQVLASASGCGGAASCCQICIWDVPGGRCQQLLSHHCTAVQALAFSLDDRLLVTLGQLGGGGGGQWRLDFPACSKTPVQLT